MGNRVRVHHGACCVLGLMLLLLTFERAQAAACCSSATISGLGRLKLWEEFSLGSTMSYVDGRGAWNAQGHWNSYQRLYDERLWISRVWATVRLRENLEVSAVLPWVVTERFSVGRYLVGQGLGNLDLNGRYELVAIGEYSRLPGVAFNLGLTVPTGTRADQAFNTPLRVGATAKGSWATSLALSFEYAHLPWFLRLDGGLTYYFSYTHGENQKDYLLAPLCQATLLAGIEIVPGEWILALSVRFDMQGKSRQDGIFQVDSAAHLLTPSISVSWQMEPHWALTSALSIHIPHHDWGRNASGGMMATLGVRYGYF